MLKEFFDQEIFISDEDSLNNLKGDEISLHITDRHSDFHIDFKKFQKLKHLRCNNGSKYRKNINSLFELRQLILFRYNMKKESISNLSKLESLCLVHGNYSNLNFLNGITGLTNLELSFAKQLVDISELKENLLISRLEIEGCKNIEHIEETISTMVNLETLNLFGVELQSVKWANRLNKLKHLWIYESNIIDGDIEPIAHIQNVKIDNKRHYNFKYDFLNLKVVPK